MMDKTNKALIMNKINEFFEVATRFHHLNLDDKIREMALAEDPRILCGIGDLYISKGHQFYRRAFDWYSLASKKNYSEAEYRLGRCYMNGWGVKVDMNSALNNFTLSSNNFNPAATYKIGFIFHYGLSVQGIDYEKARAWYLNAAHSNVAKAQYNLGVIYETGLGVCKNKKAAMVWYEKSAKLGFLLAKKCLDAMIKKKKPFNLLKLKKNINLEADSVEELSSINTKADSDMPVALKSTLIATTSAFHVLMLQDDNENEGNWFSEVNEEFLNDHGCIADRSMAAVDLDMKIMVKDLSKRSRNFFQRICDDI